MKWGGEELRVRVKDYESLKFLTRRFTPPILLTAAVYAFFLVIFVALFTLEITKVTKLSTTTIVNAPSNEGNIVCTPLSIFSGSEDV